MRQALLLNLILLFGMSNLYAAVEEETVAEKCMTNHKEKLFLNENIHHGKMQKINQDLHKGTKLNRGMFC